MKVAVVDWDYAYPLTSGKRLRTTNLMLSLADRHDVTYVSRGDGDTDAGRVSREYLGDHGVATVYLDHPVPAKSGVGYPTRIAKNWIGSSRPYAVDVHDTPDFRRRYRALAAESTFDLWQAEWTPYSTMLEGLPGVRRLAVAHNVDSLIWKRYAETETRSLHRRYIAGQHRRFVAFERHAFRTADRVVSVSRPDAELMRSMFGIDHVDVVDNGVDVEAYGAVRRRPEPGRLLFLGSLDWRPNQDAVRQLIDTVVPAVRRTRPAATLSIVGRRPPAWMVEAAGAADGVTLHADVPDVMPHLASAAMMVIPLRIGGGSRLKMIEALAAGVPVVATDVAAEGLDYRPGVDYAATDVDAMADAIGRWIDDPAAAADAARRGRETTADRYGWDRLGRELEASWERCLAVAPGAAA